MTNDKFSMTNFQFRLSDLVAACRAAPLRLCVENISFIREIREGMMFVSGASWVTQEAVAGRTETRSP
jgi:hypothetical protein